MQILGAGRLSSEAIAAEVVRGLMDRPAGVSAVVEKLAELEETPLSMKDVINRLPHSRTKVEEMVARGRIPMIKVEGRWLITRKAFRRAAEAGFPLPRRVRSPFTP